MEATEGALSNALGIIELLDVTIHSGGSHSADVGNSPKPPAMAEDFVPMIKVH